jgi:hypothetical protein
MQTPPNEGASNKHGNFNNIPENSAKLIRRFQRKHPNYSSEDNNMSH